VGAPPKLGSAFERRRQKPFQKIPLIKRDSGAFFPALFYFIKTQEETLGWVGVL
jgi:hypothetical protein